MRDSPKLLWMEEVAEGRAIGLLLESGQTVTTAKEDARRRVRLLLFIQLIPFDLKSNIHNYTSVLKFVFKFLSFVIINDPFLIYTSTFILLNCHCSNHGRCITCWSNKVVILWKYSVVKSELHAFLFNKNNRTSTVSPRIWRIWEQIKIKSISDFWVN